MSIVTTAIGFVQLKMLKQNLVINQTWVQNLVESPLTVAIDNQNIVLINYMLDGLLKNPNIHKAEIQINNIDFLTASQEIEYNPLYQYIGNLLFHNLRKTYTPIFNNSKQIGFVVIYYNTTLLGEALLINLLYFLIVGAILITIFTASILMYFRFNVSLKMYSMIDNEDNVQSKISWNPITVCNLYILKVKHKIESLTNIVNNLKDQQNILSFTHATSGLPNENALLRDLSQKSLKTDCFSLLIIKFTDSYYICRQERLDHMRNRDLELKNLTQKYILYQLSTNKFALFTDLRHKSLIKFLLMLNKLSTLNIGIACTPCSKDPKELIDAAQIALQHAEKTDNRWIFFKREMKDLLTLKANIQQVLTSAVENNNVNVLYQPILNTQTKTLMACEATPYFADEKTSLEFNQVVSRIDRKIVKTIYSIVIEDVFRNSNYWQQSFSCFIKTIIKIPVHELLDKEFTLKLSNLLKLYPVADNSIIFELTNIQKQSFAQLQKFKFLDNFLLALNFDDFTANLFETTSIPIKVVTVNINIMHQQQAEFITNALFQVCQDMAINSIFQFISTKKEQDWIQNYNTLGQGEIYSKALLKNKFEQSYILENLLDI